MEPRLLVTINIKVVDWLWTLLSTKLSNQENHRTRTWHSLTSNLHASIGILHGFIAWVYSQSLVRLQGWIFATTCLQDTRWTLKQNVWKALRGQVSWRKSFGLWNHLRYPDLENLFVWNLYISIAMGGKPVTARYLKTRFHNITKYQIIAAYSQNLWYQARAERNIVLQVFWRNEETYTDISYFLFINRLTCKWFERRGISAWLEDKSSSRVSVPRDRSRFVVFYYPFLYTCLGSIVWWWNQKLNSRSSFVLVLEIVNCKLF